MGLVKRRTSTTNSGLTTPAVGVQVRSSDPTDLQLIPDAGSLEINKVAADITMVEVSNGNWRADISGVVAAAFTVDSTWVQAKYTGPAGTLAAPEVGGVGGFGKGLRTENQNQDKDSAVNPTTITYAWRVAGTSKVVSNLPRMPFATRDVGVSYQGTITAQDFAGRTMTPFTYTFAPVQNTAAATSHYYDGKDWMRQFDFFEDGDHFDWYDNTQPVGIKAIETTAGHVMQFVSDGQYGNYEPASNWVSSMRHFHLRNPSGTRRGGFFIWAGALNVEQSQYLFVRWKNGTAGNRMVAYTNAGATAIHQSVVIDSLSNGNARNSGPGSVAFGPANPGVIMYAILPFEDGFKEYVFAEFTGATTPSPGYESPAKIAATDASTLWDFDSNTGMHFGGASSGSTTATETNNGKYQFMGFHSEFGQLPQWDQLLQFKDLLRAKQ